MNYINNGLLLLVLSNTLSMAMTHDAITYSLAQANNTQQITTLVNTKAIADSTKIVILPEKFRQSAIERDIVNKRLFIAQDNQTNNVVGLKKCFRLTDLNEYNDIANNEIRCSGEQSILVDAHDITSINKKPLNHPDVMRFSFEKSAIIYLGGDFTSPDYRNKGINSHLTRNALNTIEKSIHSFINTNNITALILFYGLTKANSGETLDGIDRTPSILRAFISFAQKTTQEHDLKKIHHYRYKAFMPTFDPNDTECKPLPDTQSIEGYGNVIVYSFNNTITK